MQGWGRTSARGRASAAAPMRREEVRTMLLGIALQAMNRGKRQRKRRGLKNQKMSGSVERSSQTTTFEVILNNP